MSSLGKAKRNVNNIHNDRSEISARISQLRNKYMLEPGDSIELAELSRDLHWSEGDLSEAMSTLDEAKQANNDFMSELFKKLFDKEDVEDNIKNVLKNLDNVDSKVESQDRILLKSIKK